MCSAAYLFMSWRQNMWFIVRLVGVAAREAVMFFLCCLSCAAAVLSSLLYVHPDMHPQAVRLSLFLLKLSSEVSEGLALLIPDTVNEKQASYTGRAYSQKSRAQPSPLLSLWNCIMVYTTSGGSSCFCPFGYIKKNCMQVCCQEIIIILHFWQHLAIVPMEVEVSLDKSIC